MIPHPSQHARFDRAVFRGRTAERFLTEVCFRWLRLRASAARLMGGVLFFAEADDDFGWRVDLDFATVERGPGYDAACTLRFPRGRMDDAFSGKLDWVEGVKTGQVQVGGDISRLAALEVLWASA